MILCEIFENRPENMFQKFKFDPHKCSSASTSSGSIHRDMSKVMILYPTNSEIVELMEKTLIGGMSIVNTGIGFDTDIFIKNVIYKIKNKKSGLIENKRIVAKILKMKESNQYGNAMTKPLPTGCIKKSPQLIATYPAKFIK